jgi:hypothetical protein
MPWYRLCATSRSTSGSGVAHFGARHSHVSNMCVWLLFDWGGGGDFWRVTGAALIFRHLSGRKLNPFPCESKRNVDENLPLVKL